MLLVCVRACKGSIGFGLGLSCDGFVSNFGLGVNFHTILSSGEIEWELSGVTVAGVLDMRSERGTLESTGVTTGWYCIYSSFPC